MFARIAAFYALSQTAGYFHNASQQTQIQLTLTNLEQVIAMNQLLFLAVFIAPSMSVLAAGGPQFQAPAIAGTDGYVVIPGAAVPPARSVTYRALFDAKSAASTPSSILPALNMVGSELNALAVAQAPMRNAKFIIVVHSAAMDGILRDDLYRRKFGVSNPNLKVLAALRKAGVHLFACGQQMAGDGLTAAMISRDVAVASDALIVSMTYQNRGYALMSF